MIGTRLGPYKITAKLGQGGMGEVYRAHDAKLDRQVAIKVLPAAFSADAERLARFEREAKLLAQLHHPHIASVFGLEESAGVRALVMELVEGEDLSTLLARGPLPQAEAFAVAKQVAEALEAAHEKGIVHRDLKPQNIKLAADGTVKVLDFGLAKAMDAASAAPWEVDLARSPTLMQSPTLTAVHGTQLGVILGTAAYMAPEQARGGLVDKRSDIWAFGVVLHEMLVGRSPFAADTVSDTLAAVLLREIDFSQLPLTAPPAIRRLVRRCLERNPKNRLHDIADARLVIDEVLAGRPDEAHRGEHAGTGPRRSALPWVLGGLAAVWAVWASLLAWRGAPRAAQPGVAFTVPWRGTDSPRALLRSVALSRDGRRLLVWSDEGVLLRDLEGFTARTLALPPGVQNPFFAPDGQAIGFGADGKIQKVALDGGDPVKLCDSPTIAPGGAWGADGFIYFTPGWNSGLWRVPQDSGKPEQISGPEASQGSFHGWPSPLPDGRGVLFTMWGNAGATDAGIAYYDNASRKVVTVTPGAAAQYLTTGEIVFFRHGVWFAAPFDARAGRLAGPERRVLAAMRPITPPGDAERDFSFSDDGRLAYIAGTAAYTTPYAQLAWVDRAGHVERLPFEGPHDYGSLALSPDDRRAAVSLAQDGEVQIWVYDLVAGTRERLTRDGLNLHPRWSPDGTHLGVTSLTRGDFDLRLISSGGLAPPSSLVTAPVDDYQMDWTPDGRAIVFMHSSSATGIDIWTRRLDEPEPGRPIVETPESDFYPSVSPDGRWLLYLSGEAFYVTPFPGAGERTKVSPDDSAAASWSPTTPEIFVVASNHLVSIRYEISGGHLRTTGSQVLFEVPSTKNPHRVPVSHDAQRFLMFVPVPGKTLEPEVRVLTDGFAALRAAAPTEPR